jgi:Ca2+-binding RTX toxin-like protein
MAIIYGTNFSDAIFPPNNGANTIYGWDIANLPGDQGPANDNDHIETSDYADVVYGGAGDDSIYGSGGSDFYYGGAGNDYFSLWANASAFVDGGTGYNTLAIRISPTVLATQTISIADPSITQTLTTGTSFVNIHQLDYTGGNGNDIVTGGDFQDRMELQAGDNVAYGGGDNDFIFGADGSDTFYGGTGNDWLDAANGNNFLYGEDGSDNLFAGTGNDTLNGGTGFDLIRAGAGQDTIIVGNGLAGDTDNIYGGADRDLLDMSSITNGAVWIDFGYNLGPNQLFTFNGFASVAEMESMIGTSFNDTMRGDRGSNFIDGGAGNDTILSYSPYDTLTPYASLGDVMLGGGGNDTMFSGTGNDYLDGGADNDTIEVGGGTDTVITGTGNDIVFFSPNCGTDTVTDFTGGVGLGDVLKLYGFGTAFDTAAEVKAAASQHGLDTWIVLPGTTIILQNFTATNLANDDFVFV